MSTIAVAACLLVALFSGSPQSGMAATMGAFPTGFGAHQRLSHLRSAPMILAGFGMGVCGFLGALLSDSLLGSALVGGGIAAICGFATQYGQAPWWLTLQWSIAFLLAARGPPELPAALMRGLLVFAGAALQTLVIVVAWHWHPFGAASDVPRAEAPPPSSRLGWLVELFRCVISGQAGLRYAAIAGGTVSAAILIERYLGLGNGYWVPMTALIILQPKRRDTLVRTAQRIAGTFLGAISATLFAVIVRPDGIILVSCVIALAWSTYTLQRVNYAAFSFAITSTVVFLIALTGLPEPDAAWRRTIATAIGAALAVGCRFLAGPDSSIEPKQQK
ncbi:FUSC family protein [Bradyrhizobium sp. USDA 4353]